MIINQLNGLEQAREIGSIQADGEQSEHESLNEMAIYAKPVVEQAYSEKVIKSIISNPKEKVDQIQTKTLRHCAENATT